MSKFFRQVFSISLFITFIIVGCTNSTIHQPISKQEALYTFAKLYGYFRYFHPSDEAQEIDWDSQALYGISMLEKVKNEQELKEVLDHLFLSIAPSLKLRQEFCDSDQHESLDSTSWQYFGYGSLFSKNVFKKTRFNSLDNHPKRNIFQYVSLGKFRNKINADSLKITLRHKLNSGNYLSKGALRLIAVDNEGFKENLNVLESNSVEWKSLKKTLHIKNLDSINLEFGIKHNGSFLIENFLITEYLNGDSIESTIFNKIASTRDTLYNETASVSLLSELSDGNKSLKVKIQSINKKEKSKALFKSTLTTNTYIQNKITERFGYKIPIMLRKCNGGTIPKLRTEELEKFKKSLLEFSTSPNFLEGNNEKLGNLIIMWNILQHFYPYRNDLSADFDKVLKELIELTLTNTKLKTKEILEKLIHAAEDGHGYVYDLNSSLEFRSLPIKIENVRDRFIISQSYYDSLKYLVGSEIITINGKPIKTLLDSLASFRSASNSVSLTKKALNSLLVRLDSNTFEFNVVDLDNQNLICYLSPTLSTSQYVEFSKSSFDESFQKIVVPENISYINLNNIQEKEFIKISSSLNKVVILDGRKYPTGYAKKLIGKLISNVPSTKIFLIPKIELPDQENLEYDRRGWKITTELNGTDYKVFYLINSKTVSYGETIASFFEYQNNATIVGQPSEGTNGNMITTFLPGNYAVNWTGMKVLKHDGSQLHGIGITPDVYVERTPEGIAAGRDEVLEKAIELATKHIETSND